MPIIRDVGVGSDIQVWLSRVNANPGAGFLSVPDGVRKSLEPAHLSHKCTTGRWEPLAALLVVAGLVGDADPVGGQEDRLEESLGGLVSGQLGAGRRRCRQTAHDELAGGRHARWPTHADITDQVAGRLVVWLLDGLINLVLEFSSAPRWNALCVVLTEQPERIDLVE